MRTKAKALPYPVLGRGDDFTDSQFQSTLESAIRNGDGGDAVVLNYQFLLSSPEVTELLEEGRAKYALDVQCSDTLYRRVFECEPTGEIVFQAGELYGRVEIQPCIVAKSIVTDFRAADLNPEFGELGLTFQPGDVFAIDDAQVRFIEFSRMKLESLVKVRRSEDMPDQEYRIDLDGELIIIYMGAGCKRVWDHFREDREVAPFLAMSIYKDCMHAALHALAVDDSATELRWGRALSEKLTRMGIEIPNDPSYNALSRLAQNFVANIGISRLIRNVD